MDASCLSGKDQLIFVTKEDHENPDRIEIPDEPVGIIYPSGEINWDCPCLGDLPHGACGKEFKAAFSCFHFSTAESKGSDCIPAFRDMQECFEAHPELYAGDDEDEDDVEKGETDINKENGRKGEDDVSEGNDVNEGTESGQTSHLEAIGDDRKDGLQQDADDSSTVVSGNV